MLKPPLFEMQEYCFPALYFLESTQYDKKRHSHPDLLVEARLALCEGKKTIWRISLDVSTPKDMDPATFPYSFSVFATGIIRSRPLPKGEDPLILKRMLYVNGASVLYSAARERLSLFFNARRYPAYTLPTYRFDPDDITG